jgi:hypothetical protein
MIFPERSLPQLPLLYAYSQVAFVLSPHGRGLDCYRTWEALLMGAIPIVKRSPLDPLFDGLPVVIVDDWSEITESALVTWLDKFSNGWDDVDDRLTLNYWALRIRQMATAASASVLSGGTRQTSPNPA